MEPWGTLRIPAGKIGEPNREDSGNHHPGTLKNPIKNWETTHQSQGSIFPHIRSWKDFEMPMEIYHFPWRRVRTEFLCKDFCRKENSNRPRKEHTPDSQLHVYGLEILSCLYFRGTCWNFLRFLEAFRWCEGKMLSRWHTAGVVYAT